MGGLFDDVAALAQNVVHISGQQERDHDDKAHRKNRAIEPRRRA